MRLVYKFDNYQNNDILLGLCKISKNLYNQGLYTILTALKNKKYLGYYDIVKILPSTPNLEGQFNYRLLKAQVSQQILRIVDKSVKSFFKSIKDWKQHKGKYHGMPKLPHYLPKNGLFQLIYTNQCCTIKDGYVCFSKDLKVRVPQWNKYKSKICNFQQVRVLPKGNHTIIEIVYNDDTAINTDLDKNRYASIDLGVDNLVTLITDFSQPLLYNGKQIKSFNQWFNKKLAHRKSLLKTNNNRNNSKCTQKLYEKRNNKIDDVLHKVSKHIVKTLVTNGIGNLVCGCNKGWKDSITLGKITNQSFVQIPYERLISMLKYKCSLMGITFITHEESYTSKCDSLAVEKIGKHDSYLGKRVKRGLFQSSVGKLINADVNGALNILRKVVGDSLYIDGIINSGWLFQPKKLNNIYCLGS